HANHGRQVVINGKKYPVVGEMCMNMTAVKVDSSVKIDDEVTLLGDGITVGMFGRSSGMGNAEALVNIGKNNPRFYVKDGKVVKEK
ncbi:MAG: alanine racemase C-terminal domain-containing protein, partial [Ruminococcus bromii]